MKNYLFWLLFTISCLLGSSCTPTSQNNVVTATRIVPTPIITLRAEPTKTKSPLPTTTPDSTATPAITSTPFVLPTPVPTITPTLTVDDKVTLIHNLFMNNAGCLLPCWWGIVPGQTTWLDAKKSIMMLVNRIVPVYYESNFVGAEIDFPNVETTNPLHLVIAVESGVVQFIVSDVVSVSSYSLSAILTTYGQPSEVWLRSQSYTNPETGTLWVSIYLWYPVYGFILGYSQPYSNMANDGTITSCLGVETRMKIAIWEPNQVNMLNYMQAAQKITWFRPSGYELPLEEATNLTLETFYNTYQDPSMAPCFQTPKEIWPGM